MTNLQFQGAGAFAPFGVNDGKRITKNSEVKNGEKLYRSNEL